MIEYTMLHHTYRHHRTGNIVHLLRLLATETYMTYMLIEINEEGKVADNSLATRVADHHYHYCRIYSFIIIHPHLESNVSTHTHTI